MMTQRFARKGCEENKQCPGGQEFGNRISEEMGPLQKYSYNT